MNIFCCFFFAHALELTNHFLLFCGHYNYVDVSLCKLYARVARPSNTSLTVAMENAENMSYKANRPGGYSIPKNRKPCCSKMRTDVLSKTMFVWRTATKDEPGGREKEGLGSNIKVCMYPRRLFNLACSPVLDNILIFVHACRLHVAIQSHDLFHQAV